MHVKDDNAAEKFRGISTVLLKAGSCFQCLWKLKLVNQYHLIVVGNWLNIRCQYVMFGRIKTKKYEGTLGNDLRTSQPFAIEHSYNVRNYAKIVIIKDCNLVFIE